MDSIENRIPFATFPDRVLAAWIDYFLVTTVVMTPVAMISRLPFQARPSFWLTTIILFQCMQIANSGQTPGRRLLGIAVVGKEGLLVGFWRALLREVFSEISTLLTFGFGSLWMIWDRRRRTFHDKICRTYVVRLTELSPRRKRLAWTLSLLILLVDLAMVYALIVIVR